MMIETRIKYTLNVFIPILVGGLTLFFLNRTFDLVNTFGGQTSYVYYYTFSTIVQGFVAFLAFLGMLAVFKLQRDQNRRDILNRVNRDGHIDAIDESMRLLTIELKRFSIVCLFDVIIALLGIPMIPYFTSNVIGPVYLGGNIALSIWVSFLAYPIIERVLRLTPK